MNEFIYVRVSSKERVVEFAENWSDISYKSGVKRKFPLKRKFQAIDFIMKTWRRCTVAEVEKWKAPDWIKDRFIKINQRQQIFATISDKGEFEIRFENVGVVMKIKKPPLFFENYDKYLYLYEKILFIAVTTGYSSLEVSTDLVELLKLNRIYWDNYNDIDLYVQIRNRKV